MSDNDVMSTSCVSGGLYVHVPFCHSKCPYCDFYSMPGRGEHVEHRFVEALLREWELRHTEAPASVATIYIGGGTPSSLSRSLLAALVRRLLRDCPEAREVTVEVNPEDVCPALMQELLGAGVNRVSMGVQTLDDDLLRRIGRRHTAARAIEAVNCIRAAGVENFSIDLMYGLPGQTLSQWTDTLRRALELEPPHLSAYLLSFEPGTRFTAMLASGKIAEASEETATSMYDALCSAARAAGYVHYEISNFCLPGCESRHNSSYWTSAPYLGLGPGAHSFDGKCTRSANPPSLKAYLEALEQGRIVAVREKESADELYNDRVLTGLRTLHGFTFTAAEEAYVMKAALPYLDAGRLRLSGRTLTVPEEHRLLTDALITALMRV